MEFKEIEKAVLKTSEDYDKKYNLDFDVDSAMIKLFEEIGELSEAYLTYKRKSRPEKFLNEEDAKKKLSYELADVVGVALIISKKLDINLEDALNRKWIIREWENK